GLRVVPLSDQLGLAGARSAPATAVALLLHARTRATDLSGMRALTATRQPLMVIKLGGSLLSEPAQWRDAVSMIGAASGRLVVVPGGGPFADAVRAMDDAFGLADDTAHWMAIGGMDQHAEMIAAM